MIGIVVNPVWVLCQKPKPDYKGHVPPRPFPPPMPPHLHGYQPMNIGGPVRQPPAKP